MKIRIMLKDPDGIGDAIGEAAEAACDLIADTDIPRATLMDAKLDALHKRLERWIEYGDYITVEFDTDEMTARVVPVDGP